MLMGLIYCLPAIVLRYLILKKTVSTLSALCLSAAVLIIGVVANVLLLQYEIVKVGESIPPMAAVISFFILKGARKERPETWRQQLAREAKAKPSDSSQQKEN